MKIREKYENVEFLRNFPKERFRALADVILDLLEWLNTIQ